MADRLSADAVRKLLDYNPETGEFHWKARTPEMFDGSSHSSSHNCSKWNARYAGELAGSQRSDGYIQIQINGGRVMAHRLAWLLMIDEWPDHEIDHIDGEPSNNRFSNLRAATRSENGRNTRRRADSRSGVKGVRHRSRNCWSSEICINGERIYLGYFDNIDEARKAYAAAARELHGDFARLS